MLVGKTKPSRTTWWIFFSLVVTVYLSAEASGARNTLWVARSEILGIAGIAILSLWYGKKEREKGEWVCILGSAVSLIILWVVKAPEVALVTSLVTDVFALWPTIQKSIKHPEEEDRFAWILTQCANALNVCAIGKWSFGEVIYPVWLFVLDGVLLYFLLFPRKRTQLN